MDWNGSQLYQDIIGLSRPASDRPRMPRGNRAKIFSPFAALKGYDSAVKSRERPRMNKPEPSEEQKEILNNKLRRLEKGQTVVVRYFFPEPGPDGSGGMADGVCRSAEGVVKKIDVPFQRLVIGDLPIPFEHILEIKDARHPEPS